MRLTELSRTLKLIREERELSLLEVSNKIKIKSEFLEKIEGGDYNFLPKLYVYSMLKKYAAFLKIPMDEVEKARKLLNVGFDNQEESEKQDSPKPDEENTSNDSSSFSKNDLSEPKSPEEDDSFDEKNVEIELQGKDDAEVSDEKDASPLLDKIASREKTHSYEQEEFEPEREIETKSKQSKRLETLVQEDEDGDEDKTLGSRGNDFSSSRKYVVIIALVAMAIAGTIAIYFVIDSTNNRYGNNDSKNNGASLIKKIDDNKKPKSEDPTIEDQQGKIEDAIAGEEVTKPILKENILKITAKSDSVWCLFYTSEIEREFLLKPNQRKIIRYKGQGFIDLGRTQSIRLVLNGKRLRLPKVYGVLKGYSLSSETTTTNSP